MGSDGDTRGGLLQVRREWQDVKRREGNSRQGRREFIHYKIHCCSGNWTSTFPPPTSSSHLIPDQLPSCINLLTHTDI